MFQTIFYLLNTFCHLTWFFFSSLENAPDQREWTVAASLRKGGKKAQVMFISSLEGTLSHRGKFYDFLSDCMLSLWFSVKVSKTMDVFHKHYVTSVDFIVDFCIRELEQVPLRNSRKCELQRIHSGHSS